MLPAVYRLPKDQIRHAFRNGRRVFSPPLLCYIENSSTPTPRFAIIVGKRTVKLASKRNRIKRLIRHALMALIPRMNKTIDAVVVVQNFPNELQQERITVCVAQLLKRANVLS